MEGYIAEIRMFAGNFAPIGWAFCNGQLLSISQNTALFSLLGTTYGGNGQTTFGLPNLQGRMPIGTGRGTGSSNYELGQMSGTETVTLITSEMPAHTHLYYGIAGARDSPNLSDHLLVNSPTVGNLYGSVDVGENLIPMNPRAIGGSGGSQPHNNMPPCIGINFIICLYGIYPSRP